MTAEHEARSSSIRTGLTPWLSARWPEARDLEIVNLKRPDVGASNETLFVDVHWIQDGKPRSEALVLRLKPMVGPQVFPEYDLASQYRIVNLLGRTDVPVPRLYGYEADEGVIGAPFYVMARVDGVVPLENPPYHAEGWLTECTPEQRREIWNSGIDAFSRIHKLDWRSLGFDFLDRPDLGETPLDQELGYYRDFFASMMEGRRYPLCEEALSWLEANKPTSPEPTGLCWGDAKLGNMIFQGTRCVALFDWELAHLGNPIDDVSWYLMLDRCLSEGCSIPRLDGLPDRNQTIARWEEASGLEARDLGYYEVFSAFRFSLIMHRVISIRKQTGEWPADSDYDMNNLATDILEKEMVPRRPVIPASSGD